MNPYIFRNIGDIKHHQEEESSSISPEIEAFAVFSCGPKSIFAIASDLDLLFLSRNSDDSVDDEYMTQKFTWPPERRKEHIACMTFSPCGKWLACVLANGSIEIVPASLVQPSITQTTSGLSLFPTNSLTSIELRIRDDCLGLPTCVVWYETKQRRHMLIYSNKGGDILFVDLAVRRLSASLQAPQSIHNLEMIENAAHDDMYLLVSGFAGTQWLVPLEQHGLTLRETLARIVPSELKELNVHGTVTSVRSGGCSCFGVVYEDSFKMFSTTNFNTPILDLLLPEGTFAVRYTDVVTFSIHKQVLVSYLFNCCNVADYAADTREQFTSVIGQLPDCRLLGFVALRSDDNSTLPSCVFVTETSVYVAEPKWTTREFLANLLLSDKKLTLIELYCQAVGLNFQTSCFDAIPSLLERNAVERALQICSLSKAPMYAIAKQFVERGFATFILPQINSWLFGSPSKMASTSEQAKRELSQLAFELHLETLKTSEGFEKNKADHNFKNFLLHNIWYDPDYCFKILFNLRMYDCALAVVKIHGLYESLAKEIITMDEWDEKDDAFLSLISVSGLSTILLDSGSTYCNHYLARLDKLFHKINQRQRARFLALFDPEREEMAKLLECIDISKKQDLEVSPTSLTNDIVQFFLSSLVNYIYGVQSVDDQSNVAENIGKAAMNSNVQLADTVPVACGAEHACVLSYDGSVYTFGRSRHGCLGDRVDSSTTISTPVPITFPLTSKIDVVQVCCGGDHSVCLTKNGALFSWGSNKYGQLGIGRECLQSNKPVSITHLGETKVINITSGQYHNFALDINGSAWGWGWNVYRQVGVGNRVDDVFVPAMLTVFGKMKLKAISCGYAHTIFLTANGKLYGCGNNSYGQLGLKDIKKVAWPQRLKIASMCQPLLVEANDDEQFELIASGYFHNIALSRRRRLFTWGATPQSLKFKALLQKRKYQQQAAASSASSKVTASSLINSEMGSVGSGNGLVGTRDLAPSMVDLTDVGAKKIVQLACGFHHNLLRTEDGRLYTWGKNFEFQLGHTDKKERSSPTLVASIAQPIIFAACGSDFTIVIDMNRLFWGWGKNDSCQLGFESLASNERHTSAGRVLTIQRPNKSGQRTIQLPQDSRTYVSKPVRIAGLRSIWPPEGDSEIEDKLSKKYSQLFLINVLRTLKGHYNYREMVDVCDRYRAEGIMAFILMLHGDLELSLRTTLDRLAKLEHVDASQINSTLIFYTELAEKCNFSTSFKASHLLRRIFDCSDFYKAHGFDLDAFMEGHLPFWASAVVTLLTQNQKLVPLDIKIRLQAAQLVRQQIRNIQSQSTNTDDMICHADISQMDVIHAASSGDRFSYKFSCGHVIAEKTAKDSLNAIINNELIIQRAPSLAESLHKYAQNIEGLPFDMCPICLGKNFSQMFCIAPF